MKAFRLALENTRTSNDFFVRCSGVFCVIGKAAYLIAGMVKKQTSGTILQAKAAL